MNNNDLGFLHPAYFKKQGAQFFFQVHKPTLIFKTRIVGADFLGDYVFNCLTLFHFRNGHNIPSISENIIKAPEGQGCPRCGGFVYHADQVFSKGLKTCLKLAAPNILLIQGQQKEMDETLPHRSLKI